MISFVRRLKSELFVFTLNQLYKQPQLSVCDSLLISGSKGNLFAEIMILVFPSSQQSLQRYTLCLSFYFQMFLLLHFCVNDGKVDLILQILWVGDNAATEETVKRVIEQLKHFNSRLPPDTWASIMFSLMPCRAKNLQLILSLF